MKKLLNLIGLILCLIFISCQNNVELQKVPENFDEIGILEVSVREPLKIYANPTDDFSVGKITFNKIRYGKNKGMIEIKSTLGDKLKPFTKVNSSSDEESAQLINSGLGPANIRLMFRVLHSTPEYFEILVNDDTQEIGYFKREDATNLAYISWEDYMKKAAVISTFDAADYKLYDQIDGNIVKTAKNPKRSGFLRVTDLKGDWIQVVELSWQVVENPEEKYWLKWRENGNLKIEIIEELLE